MRCGLVLLFACLTCGCVEGDLSYNKAWRVVWFLPVSVGTAVLFCIILTRRCFSGLGVGVGGGGSSCSTGDIGQGNLADISWASGYRLHFGTIRGGTKQNKREIIKP